MNGSTPIRRGPLVVAITSAVLLVAGISVGLYWQSPVPPAESYQLSPAPTVTAPVPTPEPEPLPTASPSPVRSYDTDGAWLATYLSVPYVSQLPELPTGCEITAVTMLAQYAGLSVTKEELAAIMPRSDDPNIGFQGDPASWDGGVVLPSALLGMMQDLFGSAADLTGAGWEALSGSIEAGKPVVVWIWSNDWGSHTVVLTGYSATSVWVNDPIDGPDIEIGLDYFLYQWGENNYYALSY